MSIILFLHNIHTHSNLYHQSYNAALQNGFTKTQWIVLSIIFTLLIGTLISIVILIP